MVETSCEQIGSVATSEGDERSINTSANAIAIGDVVVCMDKGTVWFRSGEAPSSLSSKETKLLEYLASRNGRTAQRSELLEDVWGYSPSTRSRTLDTTVNRIRHKLGPSCPIVTVHGEGYRVAGPVRRAPSGADSAFAVQGVALRESEDGQSQRLYFFDRCIDLAAQRLCFLRGDLPAVSLQPSETLLLRLLAQAGASGLSCSRILDAMGRRIPSRKGLTRLVFRLRRKIERTPEAPEILLTTRTGYAVAHAPVRNVPSILWSAVSFAANQIGLEDCVVYLGDHRCGFQQAAAWGPKSRLRGEVIDPLWLPVGRGIVGTAAHREEPVNVDDTSADSRYVVDCFSGGAELAIPLFVDGRVVGVLDSESRHRGFYGSKATRALTDVARLIQDALRDIEVASARP